MAKDDLAALARLSQRIGQDISLVQAAGGNTSIKADGVLWVKASGTRLADAGESDVFVPVGLDAARAAIAAGVERFAPLGEMMQGRALRPSIETSLHALLPQRVVLHLHSVSAIAWAVQPDAATTLGERLQGLSWTSLPYARPGLPLARALAAAIGARAPEVILLGNHGLVLAAEDCSAAAELMAEVERRLDLPARATQPPDLARLAVLADGTAYAPAPCRECHDAALARTHLRIAAGGSLYPDHVVFLGAGAPVLRAGEKPPSAGSLPAFLLVPEAGALVRRDLEDDAVALLRCLGLVLARLPEDAAVSYIGAEEEQLLLDWEAEKYRRALSASRASG
jgi:rhamnose utilization protein RhaD (predicted bifunctional aldolase and dehydrogenase)